MILALLPLNWQLKKILTQTLCYYLIFYKHTTFTQSYIFCYNLLPYIVSGPRRGCNEGCCHLKSFHIYHVVITDGDLIGLLFSVSIWNVGSELFPKQSTYLQIPDKTLYMEIKIMAFTFLQICNVLWLLNVPAPPPSLNILLQFWPFKTFTSFPFVRVHVSAFNVITMAFYFDHLLSVSNWLADWVSLSPG